MELFLIAIGLSADAFAVSLVCGAREEKLPLKFVLFSAFLFGLFQAVMPAIGYFFGNLWAAQFEMFGHWIAFALLAFIGGKMILDTLKVEEEEKEGEQPPSITDIRAVLLLALATSIDAFAVGVSFSFKSTHSIFFSVCVIGIVTFLISFAGFFIGRRSGEMLGDKAEIIGGTILILIGAKIVLDNYHLINL